MSRTIYVFICLLLSVNFWNLSIISRIINNDINLILTLLWSVIPFFVYAPLNDAVKLNHARNMKFIYFIIIGIFISTFSAYVFWGQGVFTTFIAQRWLYSFLLLPSLLYVAPSEDEVFKSLGWISVATIAVWGISIVAPTLISSIGQDAIERASENKTTDIGFYVVGVRFVLLYFFFLTHKYIANFSMNTFLKATALFAFIFLYQNRSLLIGAVIVYAYSLLKFRSRYKIGILATQLLILIIGLVLTKDIWYGLIEESQKQLADQDYNRWKALSYYLFEYSPNWFCYIFGNGMPSGGNSVLGNLYWSNMEKGIFASDLGMIGMWTMYGVIPLFTIYYVLVKNLIKKQFPLYLKFVSFHILLIPTIFQYGKNPGILFFSIIIYLYVYNKETQRINDIICLV